MTWWSRGSGGQHVEEYPQEVYLRGVQSTMSGFSGRYERSPAGLTGPMVRTSVIEVRRLGFQGYYGNLQGHRNPYSFSFRPDPSADQCDVQWVMGGDNPLSAAGVITNVKVPQAC